MFRGMIPPRNHVAVLAVSPSLFKGGKKMSDGL